MASSTIHLKLFASLAPLLPDGAGQQPIEPGVSVKELLDDLDIPPVKAHLIFIDGVKRSLEYQLYGGERVGIFPPVAGG